MYADVDTKDQPPIRESEYRLTTEPNGSTGATEAATAAPAQIRRPCPGCGEATEHTWAFCEWCGHDVAGPKTGAPSIPGPRRASELMPPTTGESPHTGTRRWLTGRRLVRGMAALVGAGLLTAGTLLHFDTRQSLDRSQQSLAATQHRLDETSAKLRASEASLGRVKAELASETKRRQGTERELAGVRGSLNDANDKMNLQASQIETLKSCLNGVSLALHHAAYADYSAALAALDAVQVSCDKAYQML